MGRFKQPRPLCPICRTREIKEPWKHKTCGRVCGALSRGAEGQAARRKGCLAMIATRRQRLSRQLVEDFAGVLVELDAAVGPMARAKVLARLWRQAYRNGYSAAYERFMVRGRRAA